MEKQGNSPSKMMWILFSVLGVSILVVMVGILFLSVSGGETKGDTVVNNSVPDDSREQGTNSDNQKDLQTGKSDIKKSSDKDIPPTDVFFDKWVRESQDYPGLENKENNSIDKNKDNNTNVTIDGDKAIVQWSPKTKKSKLVNKEQPEDIPVKKKDDEPVKQKVVEKSIGSVEDEMLNSKAQKIKTTVYWIQVASFSDSYKAEVLRKDFMENGLSSVISTTEVNGETWYRVRVGAFSSKDEADYYQEQIAGFADIDKTYIVEGTVMKSMIN